MRSDGARFSWAKSSCVIPFASRSSGGGGETGLWVRAGRHPAVAKHAPRAVVDRANINPGHHQRRLQTWPPATTRPPATARTDVQAFGARPSSTGRNRDDRIRLAAMAALALLVPTAAAAHTTITEPAGSHFPYQQWIDESAVPTPDVTIEVVEEEPASGGGLRCRVHRAERTRHLHGRRRRHRLDPRHDFNEGSATTSMPTYCLNGHVNGSTRLRAQRPLAQPAEPKEMTPSEWFAEACSECRSTVYRDP